MNTFVITSESEWESWREAWNTLTKHNPMMSMEWLGAWWQQYGHGHQLQILVVTQADQLLGVLPCYKHVARIGTRLRWIGSGTVCSDYLTAVVSADRAAEVYAAMLAHIRETGIWNEVEAVQFEGIASDDPWVAHLASYAEAEDYSFRVQPMVNAWRLSLSNSWEELRNSQRGRNIHKKSKKCKRRIDSGEVAIRELNTPEGLSEGMEHLIRLHQARRLSIGDAGCFADPTFERFLRQAIGDMLARRTACFTVCETAGAVIGIHLLMLGDDTVYMYQSGIDPVYIDLEPGHTTLAGSLTNAISKGYKWFDFLRGDETYKALWGAQAQPLCRVILAPPTLKAQAMEVVHRNLSWLRTCYNDLSGAGVEK